MSLSWWVQTDWSSLPWAAPGLKCVLVQRSAGSCLGLGDHWVILGHSWSWAIKPVVNASEIPVKWGAWVRVLAGNLSFPASGVGSQFYVCMRANYLCVSFLPPCCKVGPFIWNHDESYQLSFSLKSVETDPRKRWSNISARSRHLKIVIFLHLEHHLHRKNIFQVNFNQTVLLSAVFMSTSHKYYGGNVRFDTWDTVFIWHWQVLVDVWPVGENRADGLVRSLLNSQL